MQETQDRKTVRRFVIFFLISLILHFGLGIFFYGIHQPRVAQGPELAAPQQVVFVRPEDIITAPPAVNAAQLELADIAKPKVEKMPERARFKSQYNSRVDDEKTASRIPKKARLEAETAGEGGKQGDQAKVPGPKQKEAPKLAMKEPEESPIEEKPPEKELSLKDLELKPTDFKDLMELSKEKKPKNVKTVASIPSPDL